MPIRISKNRVDLENLPLIQATIKDYGEAVNALGDLAGGTDDIDLTSGNVVTATVSTATQTFTFSNPPASGIAGSFTLILTNGGSQTINWPASVIWAGGTAPTLTASGTDVLVFSTVNAGTTWQGFTVGLDMKRISVSDAPTIGIATKTGASTATVAFIAPASDGNSIILHYDAYPSSGDGTGVLTQAGSGTIDVTGLTAETAYTFTVTATNAIGESEASSASNEITTDPLYVDDVFSTYLFTADESSQSITNGIDLDGEGGLVWIKSRSNAYDHRLTDTLRGVNKKLITNDTSAESTYTRETVDSFNSNGFNTTGYNTLTYASWTFRNAPKFFNHTTVTKSSGTDATASFPDLETLGMVAVKRTDSTGSWYVWHKDLTAGKLLYLEQTAAEATLGHITVSGTTVTLVDGTLADGDYVVYAWAHDTDTDTGLIQCGSYTGDGGTNNEIELGWEPQYVLIKSVSLTQNWYLVDSMRNLGTVGRNELHPNVSDAEYVHTSHVMEAYSQGFRLAANNAYTNTNAATYIYMAIRRPNKPPESGTDVFAVDYGDSSGSSSVMEYEAGFPVDMALRDFITSSVQNNYIHSRLIQGNYLLTNTTAAESAWSAIAFDSNTGWLKDTNTSENISHMFKRAPGFFDVVCYTADGSNTYSHGLTVIPELIFVKCRSNASTAWSTYLSSFATGKDIYLNTTAAVSSNGDFTTGTMTDSVFSVTNGYASVNSSGRTYIAYLFATLDGISKVGSYTGNGTSQTIDCGFAAGARFILIKRTDSTGDWFLWDSVRGIVAGNDPHLSLNTTAAEVTSDDSIDPDTSGFIVNQVAATNINVTSASYIYLAIA